MKMETAIEAKGLTKVFGARGSVFGEQDGRRTCGRWR